MDNLGEIILIFVLVIVNGFFAASEIALISVRKSQLKQKADEGSRGADAALKLTADPTRALSTIQAAITVIGMLSSATAAVSLSHPLQTWLEHFHVPFLTWLASGFSVFLVTLIISYFTLVLGELVPKRIGLQNAESVALGVARPIRIVQTVLAPLVAFLTASTNAVARLLHVHDDGGNQVSEDEIKLLVSDQPSLLDEEKQMIYEIFGLGDTVVREVMVPRVDMTFIEDTASVLDAVHTLQAKGYSRVPVFHEDHDRVVGVIMFKDLVDPLAEGHGSEPVARFMRTPVFVPETKGILPMLDDMQQSRNQMAIVVDEYGGTAGLITLEDIVEEVVGEIADEFDRDNAEAATVGARAWVLNGTLPVEDAAEMGLPVEESDEYDTIAGWLLEELGHIPHAGEIFEHDGYRFTVQAMRRRRIARVRVTALEQPAAADALAPDAD